jgi:WD40 repeat protein
VAIAPDGTWFATVSAETVRIWDREFATQMPTRSSPADSVRSVAIAPDGTWLATGGYDGRHSVLASGDDAGTVRIWDRASGTCTASLTEHTDSVWSVAIAPDGTWLATGDGDGTVRIWDRASGTCDITLTEHTGWVPVAIAPDGTWLATGDMDGMVRIWDRASGTCAATLPGDTDCVHSVAIARDGTWLATGGNDCTVRLWDRASGSPPLSAATPAQCAPWQLAQMAPGWPRLATGRTGLGGRGRACRGRRTCRGGSVLVRLD